jgi:two-component system chemotaxis response regulator CheB
MPRNAITTAKPEHILASREIGAKLNTLAKGNGNGGKLAMPRKSKSKETRAVAHGETDPSVLPNGELCTVTCPDCGGTLWEVHEGNLMRFGCHIGHNYTDQSLLALKDANVEMALWTALRALKERAQLLTKLATSAGRTSGQQIASVYEANAKEVERQAELLRDVLLGQTVKRKPGNKPARSGKATSG